MVGWLVGWLVTSPQQRALHGQPGGWRGWPQRGHACTTGRVGVPALAGTAAPSQRKPGRVPGYETESRHIRDKSKNEIKKGKRRRGRASRRLAKKAAREARKRQKETLVAVATYNARTLAVKGKNGYGYDERVLAKGQQRGGDFIGLLETRRSGSTTFRAAGYGVCCSGQD